MEKSFEWFDLESAVNTTPKATHVKLNGMGNFMKVVNSTSRSTEEFIAGAISSLGQADRNIMYVNSTLGGLDDRLRLCAKIARPVNTAKARSVEGFENVPYLNPWEYAIEGKVGDFFSKIWAAIRSIAGKILDAIVNFIKFIGNKIASIGTKAQAKDREKYIKNMVTILPKVKAAKVDSQTINSLPWKVDANGMAKKIQDISKQYLKVTKDNQQDTAVFKGVCSADLKTFTTEEDFAKVFSKIFGITGVFTAVGAVKGAVKGQGRYYGAAEVKVKAFTESVNKAIEEGVKIAGGSKSTSPKEVIVSAFCGGNDNVGKMKIGDIVKLGGGASGSNAFIVLSNEWLSTNVNNVVATLHDAEKEFTYYTKMIDKVAKKFDLVQAANRSNVAELSKLTSTLAKDRCRLNSFFSGIVLEATSYALRFRKTVHVALKAYLKVGYGGKVESKSSESYRTDTPQSIESMFTF